MILINFNNIEEIIFYDNKLKNKLPELTHLFNQWELARRNPSLRALGKQAIMDFMNQINDKQVGVIEEYLETKVSFDKLDYHIVKHGEFPLEEAEVKLNEMNAFSNTILHRDGNQLYISSWR